MWEEFAVSGVSASTPTNIMLNAGTLYKDLTYSSETLTWSGTIIGATSGGSKFSITPEIMNIDVDGVLVKAKGLTQKIGEVATIETNMVELTKDWVKATVIGAEGISEDSRFELIESKANIEDSDYLSNFAYVGFKSDGTPIIILFDYAICTSGWSGEGKNKENAVFPATFECYANLVSGANTNKLPYHIYIGKTTPDSEHEQITSEFEQIEQA